MVRTAWPIRDDDAARFAAEFLQELKSAPDDPVTALNAARRRLLEVEPGGSWLAWSIAIRGTTPGRDIFAEN